jgi:hypothetical protein
MEEAATARPPYSVPEAEKALQGQAQGPGAGNTFGELASIELSKGDYKKAANRLMDALWIDDVWPEQEEELSDALSAAASKHGDTVMDVIPQLMSDWMTDYRANPGGKPDHPSHPSWDKGR